MLLGVSCKSEKETTPLKTDQEIQLEISMPEAVKLSGLQNELAYYWTEEDLVTITLTDGEKEVSLSDATPSILQDGKTAALKLTVPADLVGKELTAITSVRSSNLKSSSSVIDVPQYMLTSIEEWTGTLPFNLRKAGIKSPLYSHLKKVVIDNNIEKLSVQLSTLGSLYQFTLANNSDGKIKTPKELQLFSDNEWIYSGEGIGYDIKTEKYNATPNKESGILSQDLEEELDPDINFSYLLWLPTTTNQASVYAKGVSEDGKAVRTDQALDVSGDQSNIFLILQSKGVIALDKETPVVRPADDYEGGDPYFTFNDIKYWIGEGEKTAAFVLEWHDGKDPDAMVWGYRFSGEKTAQEMIEEIVNTDPRLYLVMGQAMGGFLSLFSFAYQAIPTDPPLTVTYKGKPLNMITKSIFYVDFDPRGDDNSVDQFKCSDPKAKWKTGFYENGYWVYYHKYNRLDPWGYSNTVSDLTDLEDGAWHGFSWQETMESWTGSPFGDKFIPAEVPEQKEKQ